jgi:hypothetical protein
MRYLVALLLMGLLVVVGAVSSDAQFGRAPQLQIGQLPRERSGFTFCRLYYRSVRREDLGQGWATDYSAADQNLMLRLSQFTKSEVTWWYPEFPAHAVVQATDPELFLCPFLFASDVGTAGFTEAEVLGLREYLLKGGFLWVDDFWGPAALSHWLRQISAVLPGIEAVPLPSDHPIFSTFYFVEEVPQIPSIQFWRASGGAVSERGSQSATPHAYGMMDDAGRLLVLMTHNTDIADGWEREFEDFEFFHLFSPRGYAFGINVAIWSMTH